MNNELMQLRGLIAGLIAAEDCMDRKASAANQAAILEMFDNITAERDAAHSVLAGVKAKREAALLGGAS